MESLVKTNMHEEVDKEIELEQKRELMRILDSVVGDNDATLKKLIKTYEDAEKHKSAQALLVRLDIIKYINQLRWINVEKAQKPIQIAVFNYWNRRELEY